jgi:hypothetical protein
LNRHSPNLATGGSLPAASISLAPTRRVREGVQLGQAELFAPVDVQRATGEGPSKIHLHQHTTLTPVQYIAGLTDFSPGRSKVFSNSADNELEVHALCPGEADVVIVREGKNATGRFLGLVLGTVGKGVLGKVFNKSVKAHRGRE